MRTIARTAEGYWKAPTDWSQSHGSSVPVSRITRVTHVRHLIATIGLLTIVPLNVPAAEFDLVVYGGTSAGVIAAVQAKRMGKSVVIVGPDKHLGGLSSGGLGY